jgi:hypothetical protein
VPTREAFNRLDLGQRDSRIRQLETELERTVDRLKWYVNVCRCPGEACVSACADCNKTQAIVNNARQALRV